MIRLRFLGSHPESKLPSPTVSLNNSFFSFSCFFRFWYRELRKCQSQIQLVLVPSFPNGGGAKLQRRGEDPALPRSADPEHAARVLAVTLKRGVYSRVPGYPINYPNGHPGNKLHVYDSPIGDAAELTSN